ncbi:MAG: hypothetical protein MUC49_19425 [Raineya sp.]|nr:hypothetical protein [Raineya sp.]
MKIYLIIFLFFYSWVQLIAQDRLVIAYQQFGGLHTIPPLGTRTTEFVFKQKGDKFIAKNYTFFDATFKDSKKKKIRFEKKKIISKSKIDSFINPKTPIYFKDLGFSIEEIKAETSKKEIKLLPSTDSLLKNNFPLKFDTLDFCYSHRYGKYMTIFNDGYSIISFNYNKKSIYYHNQQAEQLIKNLQYYFKAYIILKDLNIKDFEYYFGKEKVLDWFVTYLDIIQCEDYYASLFMKENPEYNTSYFKRTKKGWNFEEYLKKIKN